MQDLLALQLQVCFAGFAAFNMSCKDVYSNEVFKEVQPFVEKAKGYILSPLPSGVQNDLPQETDS